MSPPIILIGSFFPSLHNRRIAQGAVMECEAAARELGLGEVVTEVCWTYDRFLSGVRRGGVAGGVVFANYYEVAYGLHEFPAAGSLGIPLVDTSNRYQNPPLPRVVQDDSEIGRLASALFAARRCRQAVFVGFPGDFHFSVLRGQGFAAECDACGLEQLPPLPENWFHGGKPPAPEELHEWATKLPEKTGVFAANDEVGRHLWRALRSAGRRVPQDVLMLGVEDESLIPSISNVGLSSIEPGGIALGKCAARMLLAHLVGGAPLESRTLTGFATLRERETTFPHEETDAIVARALHFASHKWPDVQAWADRIGIQRRTLERHFRDVLNCTPHEYLLGRKIDHAKEILLSTDWTVARVAEEAGFNGEKWFFEAFRKATGCTPKAFRSVS